MARNNFIYIEGGLYNYEERYAGQHCISSFSVRIPPVKDNDDGIFVSVESWDLTDSLRKSLSEGQGNIKISVQGSFRQDSWVDKASGAKRKKLYVSGSSVSVLGPLKKFDNKQTESSHATKKENKAPVGDF